MTGERTGPPESVPTLTEVVNLPVAAREHAAQAAVGSAGEPESAVAAEPGRLAEREPPAPADPHLTEPGRQTNAAPVAEFLPTPAPPALSEDQLTRQILADLQRQIDLVFEYRVREVLTPILTRATDALLRDARSELTRTLHEVVARSVAEELLRQRTR